jgi:hypothetical protein
MTEQWKKPPPFKAGEPISAAALNAIRMAVPRLITGGTGICATKLQDKIIISEPPGIKPKVGDLVLLEVVEIFGSYLRCTRGGAIIPVAKPWGLRHGVDFPAGYTYIYDEVDFNHRVVTVNGVDYNQYITPDYVIGEEILACRMPSTKLYTEDDEVLIKWIDGNNLGRCWAELEST